MIQGCLLSLRDPARGAGPPVGAAWCGRLKWLKNVRYMIGRAESGSTMWSDKDFDLGIVMAHAYGVAEKERQKAAREKLKSLRHERGPELNEEYERALEE